MCPNVSDGVCVLLNTGNRQKEGDKRNEEGRKRGRTQGRKEGRREGGKRGTKEGREEKEGLTNEHQSRSPLNDSSHSAAPFPVRHLQSPESQPLADRLLQAGVNTGPHEPERVTLKFSVKVSGLSV